MVTLYLLIMTKEYHETVIVLQLDLRFIGNIIEKKTGKVLKEYVVHHFAERWNQLYQT